MRRKPFTWEEKRRIYCDYTCGARCDDLAQKWGCTAGAINVVVHKMHAALREQMGIFVPQTRGANLTARDDEYIFNQRRKGLTFAEIAKELGRDVSTIRAAFKRAEKWAQF